MMAIGSWYPRPSDGDWVTTPDAAAPRVSLIEPVEENPYSMAPIPWTWRQWDRLKGIVGTAALVAFYFRDWIWGLMT